MYIGGAAPPVTQYNTHSRRRIEGLLAPAVERNAHCAEKLSHPVAWYEHYAPPVNALNCKTRYPTLLVGQCNDVGEGGRVGAKVGEDPSGSPIPPKSSHTSASRRICPRYFASTMLPIVSTAFALFLSCVACS